MPKNIGPDEDQQDHAFAQAVELARERAKALYLHREVSLKVLSNAFDAGFEAAMEFCASDEFDLVSNGGRTAGH